MNSRNIKKIISLIHCPDRKSFIRLRYWIDVFDESNIKFGIIVRNYEEYLKIKLFYYKYNVFYANTNLEVEKLFSIMPKLKNIYYMVDHKKNIHPYLFSNINHIFIGTKNFDTLGKITKSYKAYDEIWVSSEYMSQKFKETFKDLGHLKIKTLGRPQNKNILSHGCKSSSYDTSLIILSKKNERIANIFCLIANKYFNKTHLVPEYVNNSRFKAFIKNNSLNSSIVEKGLKDFYLQNIDIFIMDIHSFDNKYLLYNKPIVVYTSGLPGEILLENNYEEIRNCIYIVKDFSELENKIQDIMNNDFLENNRVEYLNYMFGRYETLTDKFIKELKRMES